MIIAFRYAYLVLTIPFIVGWLLLFVLSKKTRKQQLIMSLLLILGGTISELLYFQDYWKPASILFKNIGPIRILLEDFLFAFSAAGIGSVIYDAILRKEFVISARTNNIIAFLSVAIIAVSISFIMFILGINSIFATSIGMLVATLYILIQRKDLLPVSLLNGLFTACIMFIFYSILFNVVKNADELFRQGWLIYKTPLDIRILGIPLTEIIWGFVWGALLGPIL